jgi:hypothetical protein
MEMHMDNNIIFTRLGMLLAVASGAIQLFTLIKLKRDNATVLQTFTVLSLAIFAIISFAWLRQPAGAYTASNAEIRESGLTVSLLYFAILFNLIGSANVLGAWWHPFENKGKSRRLAEEARPNA